MKIYLASPENAVHCVDQIMKSPFILQSYVYFKDWNEVLINDDFLLDSGAFTFMSGRGGHINWEKYTREYAEFIKKYNVKNFFELDIDAIVGLQEVERLRDILEKSVGMKCIPVWHKSRGKDYFLKMVKEYDYVAIGGIVTKEIKPSEYKYFRWFIDKAHEADCKIHGLGFTAIKQLKKYNFDSVDSSSWTSGRRFGGIYIFNGGDICMRKKKNHRVADYKKADAHNIREWIKFQYYALHNL